MKVSTAGRAAIMQREGCRLSAYRDSVGVITIGVGHTGRMAPPPVTARMTITKEQADEFLAADLAPVEAMIARVVKVTLSQNEFDALASLAFNIGVGGLARSTVVARLNRSDRAGAAQAFLLWAHPPELVGRRRAEARQFVTPDAIQVAPVVRDPAIEPQDKLIVVPSSTAPGGLTVAVAPQPAPVAPADKASPAPAPAPSLLTRIASFFGR